MCPGSSAHQWMSQIFKVRSKETAPLREAIMGEASLMRTSKLSVITNADVTILVSALPFCNRLSDVVIPSRVVLVRVFSFPLRDHARVTTDEHLGKKSRTYTFSLDMILIQVTRGDHPC